MIRERPSQPGVVALLEAERLPVSDLTESHLEHFFYAGSEGAPSAIVGLELFGPDALLRSLVVSSAARTQGVGSALVLHAERYAASHQVRALYLLTNTAEGYFEHRGYRRLDRARAPPAIQSTREFASLCPSSSAFMIKRLYVNQLGFQVHTLGRIPVYGEDTAVFNHGESTVPVEAPAAGCCVPGQRAQPASCCAK